VGSIISFAVICIVCKLGDQFCNPKTPEQERLEKDRELVRTYGRDVLGGNANHDNHEGGEIEDGCLKKKLKTFFSKYYKTNLGDDQDDLYTKFIASENEV
jgi:hypothetical protein